MKKLIILVLITSMLFSNEKDESLTQKENILLHMIAYAEGTTLNDAKSYNFESEYDLTYGYGKYIPDDVKISQLSIKEIRKLRKKMIKLQKEKKCKLISTAMGKFGWTSDNFELFVSRFPEIDENTIFDKEIQDMFAKKQIEVIGFNAFLEGRISLTHYQKNLSKKWASIPDPYTGKSRYSQPLGISNEKMKLILYKLKNS